MRIARLAGLAMGACAAEAALLRGLGLSGAAPVAPQVAAPLPWSSLHDLRWLMLFSSHWLSLAGEVVLLVAARSAITALMLRWAWPADLPAPSLSRLAAASATGAGLTIVLMAPWAALSFSAAAVSLGWPLLAGLLGAVVTAAVLAPAGTGPGWVAGRMWPAAGWVLISAVVLSMSGLVIAAAPAWWQVPAAALGGAADVWLWIRLVRSSTRRRRPNGIASVPVIAVGTVVCLLAGSAYLVGHIQAPTVAVARRGHGPTPPHSGTVVVVVAGFDSAWDGSPTRPLGNLPVRRFSYRGQAADGAPLAYGSDATYQSLPRLASLLRTQIDTLHQATGKPVDVVAMSEGTLLLRRLLAARPAPAIGRVVLLSPLAAPASVYYPPPGGAGWGLAGGWAARVLLRITHAEDGRFDISADLPFLRSLVDDARLYRSGRRCLARGVATAEFVPLTAATVDRAGASCRVPTVVVPSGHGLLLDSATVRTQVARFLTDGHVPPSDGWKPVYDLVRGISAAWRSPSLPLSMEPDGSGGSARRSAPIGLAAHGPHVTVSGRTGASQATSSPP